MASTTTALRWLALVAALFSIALRSTDEISQVTNLTALAACALIALATWPDMHSRVRPGIKAAIVLVIDTGFVLWADFSARLESQAAIAASLTLALLVSAATLVFLVRFALQEQHVLGAIGVAGWAVGWASSAAVFLWVNASYVGVDLGDLPLHGVAPTIATVAGSVLFAILAARHTRPRAPTATRVGLGAFALVAVGAIAMQHRLLAAIDAATTVTAFDRIDALRLQRDIVFAVLTLGLAAWLRAAERAKPTDPIPPATVVS